MAGKVIPFPDRTGTVSSLGPLVVESAIEEAIRLLSLQLKQLRARRAERERPRKEPQP